MHRILTGIGLAAAVVLIGASATMNYLFAISLGKTWFEGQVLGAVSVAADILAGHAIRQPVGRPLQLADAMVNVAVCNTLVFALRSLRFGFNRRDSHESGDNGAAKTTGPLAIKARCAPNSLSTCLRGGGSP